MAKSRARQVGRILVRCVLGAVLVLSALLVALVLALDLPSVRELVRGRANQELGAALVGKVTLERIGTLGLRGVGDVDATVRDTAGRRVLVLRGVTVEAFWPRIVWSALTDDEIEIALDAVRLEHGDVAWIDDGAGRPTLAGALEPKPKPKAPGPATEVRVTVPRIRIEHVWIHGQLADGPILDGDVRELEADLRYDKKGLSTKLGGVRLAFRALPEKLDPNGTVQGRLELPATLGPRGSGRFVGTVAGTRVLAEGAWDGSTMRARVRAPDISAETLRERIPGLEVRDSASASFGAEGKWPEVRFDGELSSRALRLGLRGQALIAEESRVSIVLDAREVDLSRLAHDAPTSALSTHAEVGARILAGGAVDGDYRITIPGGRLADGTTPAVETHGRLTRPGDGDLAVDGQLAIDERAAPVDVSYRLRTGSGGVRAHAELSSKFQDPPRLHTLGLRASGTLSASGDFDSRDGTLDARARLRVTSLHHEAVRARSLELDADLDGPMSDPRVDLHAVAGSVDAFGRRFARVQMTASGRKSALVVRALVIGKPFERAEGETRISFAEALELERPHLKLHGRDGSVELAAARVHVSAGLLRVESFSLDGAGRAHGNLELAEHRRRIELSATDLELGRIARLLSIRVPFERAFVSADISLDHSHRRGTLTGRARAQAREIRIAGLDGASSKIDLVFDERDLSGTAEADFGRVGRAQVGRIHVELERFRLPREPWTLERLARQPGSLSARGDLRLRGLMPLIEASGLPVARLAGRVRFDVSAAGGHGSAGPQLEARLETQRLRVIERREQREKIKTTTTARRVEPRSIEDVDLRALVTFEPEERVLRADLELYDPRGTIVSLDGDARLPPDWPRTLASSWRTLPLQAKVEVPRRPLDKFPKAVRPAAQKGNAFARVELEGSIAEPVIDAEVQLDALKASQNDEPLRASANARYERSRGSLSVAAEARGRSVAMLTAAWRGDVMRLATTRPNARSPVELDIDGELREFPLKSLPALADRQIGGSLDAKVHLEGLGRDARLEAWLDGKKTTIGRVRMQRLRAELSAKAGAAHVHVEGGDAKGNAVLELDAPLDWGARLVPSAPSRAEGRLAARAFDLEVLNPLVSRYLNEVGGRLDADLHARLEPGRTALAGEARLKDGVVQIPAVGQRFTDVEGRLDIDGDRVVIDDIAARGSTGRLTARASARLDGLALRSANAHLAISKKQKLPLTLQGAAVGDAWGFADIEYKTLDDGSAEVLVEVPSFHVELAEQGDLEVQDLEDVESIRIGARLRDGTFTALPVQPLESNGEDSEESAPMRTRVRLGRDVEIERGRALKVRMAGEISMATNGETEVTGRLELRGGTLDVQGKLFDIERGVVTFAGDPSNPTITAIARWDSPADYTVYAEYSGDVRTGKITLRSEPPLTQDEIASLIMFGTPEGSTGSESADPNAEAASAAVGVAGDTAARGINRAVSNLTRLDVAARVDTSTGNPRPELVVQITPRIAARVTRAVGEPQAGQPPDRTFVSVEFRFTRSWSVSAVVGDHGGSGMDVIWRRRY